MTGLWATWALVRTAAAGCDPLPLAEATAMRADAPPETCLLAAIEGSGRAYAVLPPFGVWAGVSAPWARAELGIRKGFAQVRAAVAAVRSGGDEGYIGVAGESIVPVVQVAEARLDLPAYGVAAGAGLVDDPFVFAVEPAWGHPEIVRTLALDEGYADRSDMGAYASFTAPERAATATIAVTTGEGLARRERNNAVDVTGVVRVRPVRDAGVVPEFVVMGRYGTRGLGSAPDHRVAGAAVLRSDLAVAGAELVFGWGLDGDASLAPLGLSAWVRNGVEAPVVALARFDLARDDRALPDSEEILALAAAGLRLPPLAGPFELVAGWQGRRAGPDARGTGEGLARSDLLFVQLTGKLRIGLAAPSDDAPAVSAEPDPRPPPGGP